MGKICRQCPEKGAQPLKAFCADRRSVDGLCGVCRKCARKANARSRAKAKAREDKEESEVFERKCLINYILFVICHPDDRRKEK